MESSNIEPNDTDFLSLENLEKITNYYRLDSEMALSYVESDKSLKKTNDFIDSYKIHEVNDIYHSLIQSFNDIIVIKNYFKNVIKNFTSVYENFVEKNNNLTNVALSCVQTSAIAKDLVKKCINSCINSKNMFELGNFPNFLNIKELLNESIKRIKNLEIYIIEMNDFSSTFYKYFESNSIDQFDSLDISMIMTYKTCSMHANFALCTVFYVLKSTMYTFACYCIYNNIKNGKVKTLTDKNIIDNAKIYRIKAKNYILEYDKMYK